ncbi:SDR family NAD(P)-dependent oxidoreductase [Phyllobacterium myrsinacearum]|uniref:NAD(P)-dependent dehydrogenase (Short-subunit alcohol dehydrogenase family) n=1 Tax=Phyllobacterium myrsinacearum TaxID=28101 RepID=A0A839EQF4_9HYPH|nr:SDR family NAD(P)-dependent oxidoreductase [Phyllobacterium myrsinacearum]MBA8879646.1 NAD(P)-dependent dehydrogenase (short-subunit alcohol dehydrogenase family) [Phyllobacterium myrsinacearum]
MTQSILIVAAERGLGLGLAQQFFNRGWSVVGTARAGSDTSALEDIGRTDPNRLAIAAIDVTDATQIAPFLASLADRRFDVIYLNAGIWGAFHQSVTEATDEEFAAIMLTNTFGPARLARHLLGRLIMPGGTLAFMSSHRGSITMNVEGGLELYRTSKVALNMLTRGIFADNKEKGLTVLSIHPGWARTSMGTLDGAIEPEIEVEPSVRGVADVVETHMGTGENLYLDYQNNRLDW